MSGLLHNASSIPLPLHQELAVDDVDCILIVITPSDRAREILLALLTSPMMMCLNICYLERTFNHFYYVMSAALGLPL